MSDTMEGQTQPDLEATDPLTQGWPVPTRTKYESSGEGERVPPDENETIAVIKFRTHHQVLTGRPARFDGPAAEAIGRRWLAQANYLALSMLAENRVATRASGRPTAEEEEERSRTTETLAVGEVESILSDDE